MLNLLNWAKWKEKTPNKKELNVHDNIGRLEAALRKNSIDEVPNAIRSYCESQEYSLSELKKLAEKVGFNNAQKLRMEIFGHYYSNHIDVAFSLAQKYFQEYDFEPDLHVISLVCLYQANQFEDAYKYQKRLDHKHTSKLERPDYWQMVAVIRWANNDMVNLEEAADRSVELAPDNGSVLQTALGMYVELGRIEKVMKIRAKLSTIPDGNGYALALSLLALGHIEEGLNQMEARYDHSDAHRFINVALKSKPRWKGESLNQTTLLVSAEQGLGDTIQMARYLAPLLNTDASAVVLETQPETLTFLQHNFPGIKMVERVPSKMPEIKFDKWVGAMSLPLTMKGWGKDTPGRHGYLIVPPDNANYWKDRVAQLSKGERLNIGIAWSGQPNHRADRRRSIQFNLIMRRLAAIKANFFALQTNVKQSTPPNVLNVSEELITLADTAALIEQMDLVITVDTSIVHIAGALGKTTWLLLPKRYEWRWGLEGESNNLYESVKVFRQTEHADWTHVLHQVFEIEWVKFADAQRRRK